MYEVASQDMMSYWGKDTSHLTARRGLAIIFSDHADYPLPGYKFESLCMLPDTWDNTSRDFIDTRHEHVVDNHEQYVSVVETKIGNTTLILGGEVDGSTRSRQKTFIILSSLLIRLVWNCLPNDSSIDGPSCPRSPRNYVELKTNAVLKTEAHARRFDLKLLKVWAQSYLLGVPIVVFGFRTHDNRGTLVSVDEGSTVSIPTRMREDGFSTWDECVCINFVADFLNCRSHCLLHPHTH
jgi:RAT1-interacting protein